MATPPVHSAPSGDVANPCFLQAVARVVGARASTTFRSPGTRMEHGATWNAALRNSREQIPSLDSPLGLEHQEVLIREKFVLPDWLQTCGPRILEEGLARHLVFERWANGKLTFVEVDVHHLSAGP